MKFQIIFPHGLAQDSFIETIKVKHTHLASQLCHIFNQLIGLRFTDAEVVFFTAILFQKLNKCFYRKRIMLRGHTELMLDRGLP